LGIILLIINEVSPYIYFLGEDGEYIGLAFFFMPATVIFVGLLMTLSVVIVYIRYLANIEKVAIISFLLLPMLSMITLLYDDGKFYTNIAIVISVMIMFFAYEINYSDYMVNLEKNLNDEKLRIINRQMQPHFIFNSLALIRYLCRTNPQEAVKSIDDFSVCMRKTTDFMGHNQCTDVANEIDLVKHYLNIQKKRFNEKIDIEFSIKDEDFCIPPFSIQTLTENALHHGLCDGQVEDAKIVIKTEKVNGNHIVVISDNGVGFDVSETQNDESGHVGISNTRKRIEVMCNGELVIDSKPDTGTSIKIIIPE
ncbi:MAG: histidine kinase, partial [Eubacterium sp.]|nr:histidine kinase [Eubacterium sp.]